MRASFVIKEKSEIPRAVAWLEGELDGGLPVCFLLCEELLSYLTEQGGRETRLSVAGRKHRFVEIRAAGEPDDLSAPGPAEDEDSRIASEIQLNLLDQYAQLIDYQYKKGVNRYRIYPDGPTGDDQIGRAYV